MLKFSASVLCGEVPVYDGDSLIAFTFQRQDLSFQYHLVADSMIETLITQDAQLYLSHIQPTAVYRSVVKLHQNALALMTELTELVPITSIMQNPA